MNHTRNATMFFFDQIFFRITQKIAYETATPTTVSSIRIKMTFRSEVWNKKEVTSSAPQRIACILSFFTKVTIKLVKKTLLEITFNKTIGSTLPASLWVKEANVVELIDELRF